ncbi:MrcB family domain-containing protein [Nocardia brasiliensis]|uniref:MrcB family domain-containing protein n=1 Tax=Nocardia brasiliensis TaxID=37326 RepID=UPI003409DC9E
MPLGDLLRETLILQQNWTSEAKSPSMRRRRELVEREIPAWLGEQQQSLPRGDHGWEAEGSSGKGGPAEIPWSRSFLREFSPKAGVGWYLVYLFAADGRSVYLSLNQGTTTWDTERKDFVFRSQDGLRERVEWAREQTRSTEIRDTVRDSLVEEIDLQCRGRLGRAYQVGNVWSVEYRLDDMPSEEQLRVDFRNMTALLTDLYKADPETGSLGEITGIAPEFEDDLRSLARQPEESAGGDLGLEELVEVSGREHAEWQPDGPASIDVLKRGALAKVLATRLKAIRESAPEESFLIHVDGPWGAGKSTLLQLLKAELDKDFVVVEYDAWRNARVDPPWWALLTTLRVAVPRTLGWWQRSGLRLKETWQRIRRTGSPFVLPCAVLATVVFLLAWLVVWGLNQPLPQPQPPTASTTDTVFTRSKSVLEFVWRLIPVTVGLIGLLVTLWTGALTLGRRFLWESARGARLYEQAALDPMENVAAHFGWLLSQAPRPVVFFIDDLDRCKEGQVVALLEAAQTMMRTAPPPRGKRPVAVSFVVAADGAWLRQAYEVTYDKFLDAVAEPGRPLGYLFLDKLFQLSVPLPAIGAAGQKTYFRGLLGGSVREGDTLGDEVDKLRRVIAESANETEVLDALRQASPTARERVSPQAVERMSGAELAAGVEHALERFAPLLDGNPRRMKRYINCYTVTRAARTLEGSAIETDALALWVLLQIRWPELAEYLRRKPDAIATINEKQTTKGWPEDLAALLHSSDLREVIGQAPIKLTGNQIRECCGAQPDDEPAANAMEEAESSAAGPDGPTTPSAVPTSGGL